MMVQTIHARATSYRTVIWRESIMQRQPLFFFFESLDFFFYFFFYFFFFFFARSTSVSNNRYNISILSGDEV